MTKIGLRIGALFHRRQLENDLDDELEFHLAMQQQKLIDQGMPPEEARCAARRAFGNPTQTKETSRELWTFRFLETLAQDLRYGLRQLRRNPGFTVVAVLTLALGIGANTAIFSLVNAVMLRNLPVRDPGRLVLFSDNPDASLGMGSGGISSGQQRTFSYPFYQEVRDHSRLFEGICAFQTPEDMLTVRPQAGGTGGVQVAEGKMVSGNFFSVLGVNAALGRTLTPADDQPNAPPVGVVSFSYWQNKLGGGPSIVGSTLDIDSIPFTVVGVAPAGFYGVRVMRSPADFWLPLALRPRLPLTVMPQAKSLLSDSNASWLNMMGRLKPGVSIAQARAEIDGELRQYVAGRIGSKMTSLERQRIQHAYVELVPGGRGLSEMRHNYSEPLCILLAIVGLVLLIACANVANLLLARATARHKEMAMRMALGGSRGRLVRQVLVESALLAVAGGVAGAFLAFWGVHVLVAMVAARVPLNVRPDLAVLAFAAGVVALAVILSGLVPAIRAARVDLVPALKAGSAQKVGQRTGLKLDKSLVTFQIAASLLLIVGAALLVHSLVNLENQDLGFRPQHVLLLHINTELAGYRSKQLHSLYRELLDRVRALPGVRSASMGSTSPMSGSQGAFNVSVEGQPLPSDPGHPQVVLVSPGYFKTEGMLVVAGRAISARDTETSPPVAVVNQAFARKFIPRGNPIGTRLSSGTPFQPPGMEIVGVAQDAKYSSAREPAGPMVFVSAFQMESAFISGYVNEFEVRTTGDPAAVTGEVRQAIHEIDSNLPITNVTTQSAQVNDSLGQQRALSVLTGFFGVLSLLLACVGLYGIMAYSVARRTHEIGIRMALGAEKRDVLRMVIGQGLKLAVIGVAIGIAGAMALTRFLSSLLYGVTPTDPLTFIAVSLILIAVALLACYIPARRAAKVDPMVALRYE